MRSQSEKNAIVDTLLGKPFVLLPGLPVGHRIVGRDSEGCPISVDAVEGLWNDALLIDAVEGPGHYASLSLSPREVAILALAESLYGATLAEGIEYWLTLPNLSKPYEWRRSMQ